MIETLLKKHAYRTGTFTLSSGKVSNEYLDVKNAICAPQVVPYLAGGLHALITDAWNCPYEGVAGVVLGGALLAAHLALRMGRPCLPVRLAAKDHGSGAKVEGLANLPASVAGDKPWRVILVEDVVTTGDSTVRAMQLLKEIKHFEVTHIVAVVDREEGGLDVLRKAYPSCKIAALTTLKRIREEAI